MNLPRYEEPNTKSGARSFARPVSGPNRSSHLDGDAPCNPDMHSTTHTTRPPTVLMRSPSCSTEKRIANLASVGIEPGWNCLDVGAGGGTIATWLCTQVGPRGGVTATDINTRFLKSIRRPNLQIQRHDIVSDSLPEGRFERFIRGLYSSSLPTEKGRSPTCWQRSNRVAGLWRKIRFDFAPGNPVRNRAHAEIHPGDAATPQVQRCQSAIRPLLGGSASRAWLRRCHSRRPRLDLERRIIRRETAMREHHPASRPDDP